MRFYIDTNVTKFYLFELKLLGLFSISDSGCSRHSLSLKQGDGSAVGGDDVDESLV